MIAFNNIGHFEELERYFNYIVNLSVKVKDRFQPLYGITGETALDMYSCIVVVLSGPSSNKWGVPVTLVISGGYCKYLLK